MDLAVEFLGKTRDRTIQAPDVTVRKHFDDKLKTIRKLTALNIPGVIAATGKIPMDHPNLVMPWCGNGSIETFMLSTHRSASDVLDFAIRSIQTILETLSLVHANGIYHLRLHPKKILVRDDHSVVIGDWGMAWADPFPSTCHFLQ